MRAEIESQRYPGRMTTSLPALAGPGNYVAGHFAEPASPDGELIALSPADTRDQIARYGWSAAHVDEAVYAARAAYPAWRRLGEPARRELLFAYQSKLREQRELIALTIAREVGKPLWEAKTEADAMIAKVDLSLGEGARYTSTETLETLPGEIRHAPLGVLAVIGPFNFPGHLPNGQIVPALLTGNTVVHKPSEKTPCTATLIARCMHEAGIPKGVFNVVQGDGSVGAKLSTHPEIDGVLFTGSVDVGRRIAQANAARPDRLIALELGGKNASIALDDCDLERTARAIVFAAFVTAGQRCTATSRLFVTRGIAERLIARIAELTRAVRIGGILEPEVFMGPVISDSARDALTAAQAKARANGFENVVTGAALRVDYPHGFYMRPSVVRAEAPDVEVPGYTDAELFGPDLALHVVRDEDHALELASRSRFGLAAGVFTSSREAFERAVDALRAGVVCWNRPTAGASGRLPFGGVKDSGNHRPAGIFAGLTCTQPIGVMLTPPMDGALPTWPGFAPANDPKP
jgi:succinylglutamic semialdehyde dehydrogenase